MTITIPTSLADVTLGQYLDLSKCDPNDTTKQVAILCNIQEADVKRMEQTSLNEIQAFLSSIEVSDEEEFGFTRFVSLKGRKFGFHPNLSEISVGEYVDLDSLSSDPLNNLPAIMAILYRPVTTEAFDLYKIAPYTGHEDANTMLQMPMNVVLGALNFFFRLGVDFVRSSTLSLKEEVKRQER